MTSMQTISSTIDTEAVAENSIELTENENFNVHLKSANQNENNQNKSPKRTQVSSLASPVVRPMEADDIPDYKLWAIASSIICFFVIAPFFALYHSARVRKMKRNREFTKAIELSRRVNSLLMLSNIIGAIVWLAAIFVIGVLFVMGRFL